MWYVSYLLKHAFEIQNYSNEEDVVFSDLLQFTLDVNKLLLEKKIFKWEYTFIMTHLNDTISPDLYTDKTYSWMMTTVCNKVKKLLPYYDTTNYVKRLREDFCLTKSEQEMVSKYLKQTRKEDNL
jgi:hypothetical protein